MFVSPKDPGLDLDVHLPKMDVKISLAVSLALNQILTGELDTSFPIELRSVQTPLRWTSNREKLPFAQSKRGTQEH